MATVVSEALRRGDTPRAPGIRSALVEFLLVGGLTPFLYPLSWLARRTFGLDASEYAIGFLMFHAAHLINDPHFSVTYLLFYEDFRARAFGAAFPPSLRARYLVVGVLAPVVLLVWAGYGAVTRSAPALGALVQTMFLLVGWHYVKQGFGVLAVLSARRGVTYTGDERLLLLLHGYAGWAYAWASPADPGTLLEEKGVVFTSWARSVTLERVTFALFVASFAAVVVMLARRARRERRLPHPAPLLAYLSSIWAWSVYSGIDPLVRYVVPALHSIQYLVMVRLLRENEAREREGPPRFERSARVRVGLLALSALFLGLLLFHGVGQALDAVLVTKREAFLDSGPTPYFAAVYVVVNLHHYLMDTVLWRRENPRTRYLRGPI
jgi:hypothetical protein